MKKLLFSNLTFLSLVVSFALIGCEKDCDDDVSKPVDLTKTEMLTANTWVYAEFYQNWQQPSQLLAYKKGRASNTIDYSLNRVKFFKDGSFEEIQNNGVFRAGIWQFQNNETQISTGSMSYTNNVTVIKLTADSLIWHDVANKSYGVQVAKK